jgi:hypothetical protein
MTETLSAGGGGIPTGEFDLRTVEKAYYQQYRNTHDVGRW